MGFSRTPRNPPRQHFPAAIDPSPQFLPSCDPVPLIDPPPERRGLETPRAKVEGEVDDGRETVIGLGGEHRAVAHLGAQ